MWLLYNGECTWRELGQILAFARCKVHTNRNNDGFDKAGLPQAGELFLHKNSPVIVDLAVYINEYLVAQDGRFAIIEEADDAGGEHTSYRRKNSVSFYLEVFREACLKLSTTGAHP